MGSDREVTGELSEVNFGSETLKATLAKFTMALSGFVGTIVFARLLGPVGFGGFYLLLSVIQMADRPFRGLLRAVKKRYAETESNKSEIVGSLILIGATWGAFILGGGWVFRDLLESYTQINDVWLPFAVLSVGLLGTAPLALLQAEGMLGVAEWVDTVRSYLTLALQLTFVFLAFGSAGMAYGLSAATIIIVPVCAWYLNVRPTLPSRETLVSLWEFARYSIPSAFVGRAYHRFDLLLLGLILTPAAAADYEVAAKLTLPATFVASAASSLLMPRVSETDSRGESVAEDISHTLAFGSVLSVPILFGAIAIPEAIVVTAFGGEYASASKILTALAVYRVIDTQTEPLMQSLDGIDRPNVVFKLSTIALAVNIPLGVWLVFEFGAVGVVIATIVAEFVRYAGAAYTLSREVKNLDLFPLPLGKQFLAGLLMLGVVEPISRIVNIASWIDLLFVVGTGAGVYGMVLLLISDELRLTVRDAFEDTPLNKFVTRLLNYFESSSR